MNTIILQIAFFTFKEALKLRVLHGVFIATLFIMFFSLFISGLFMRDILKVLLDLCLSSVSISGLLVPFFVIIKMHSEDVDNKTIYTFLARPVSRTHYILGRYLGVAFLTFSIMIFLTFATLITQYIFTFLFPKHFFEYLSIVSIIYSSFTSFLGVLVLNSTVMLWCFATSSTFLATLLSIATYVIGQSTENITRFVNTNNPEVTISPLLKIIVKSSMYIFPNLHAFDTKLYGVHGQIIPFSELILLNLYAISYITPVLLLTILIFYKRDL